MTLLFLLILAAPSGDSVRCMPLGTSTAGLLYLSGNRVDPPFHLTGRCTIGADTTWRGFYLNGFEIWKEQPPPPPLDTSGTTATSRQLRAIFQAGQRFRELRERRVLPYVLSPAAGLAAAYQADTAEVDSTRVLDTQAFDIYWRGQRTPEHIQMSDDSLRPSHRQWMHDLFDEARRTIRLLSSDRVVLLRGGMGRMTIPPASAHGAWWAAMSDSLRRGEVSPIGVFRDPQIVLELRHPGPLPPRGCASHADCLWGRRVRPCGM